MGKGTHIFTHQIGSICLGITFLTGMFGIAALLGSSSSRLTHGGTICLFVGSIVLKVFAVRSLKELIIHKEP